MNNTTIFMQHSSNFQFLSVCYYITNFGILFHNLDLIPSDERNHSVSVLNNFFDYIHNSKNESETKLQLLRKVLRGTDLYGGGDNQTLDIKYVDETYQYIISTALFSHFGNIDGYLAGLINRADNVSYSALKKKVFHDLSENLNLLLPKISDYCSYGRKNIKLTQLAVEKIFHNHIWPIFPEPDQDISILDVNYIYAMVGLKIVRSIQDDRVNLSFHNYIHLSRAMEFQILDEGNYQLTLELFATPALFYFAYTERKTFRTKDISSLDNEFWHQAYEKLFHFTNRAIEKAVEDGIQQSLHYKLQTELESLESRTSIAAQLLRAYCDHMDYAKVSFFVPLYKSVAWLLRLFFPSCHDLPDLQEVYEEQFVNVRKIYNDIEKNSLEQVLTDGNIIGKMDSNATVSFADIPNYRMHCMYCPPMPRKMNEDIYLMFAIIREGKTEFYALRQHENSLALLINSKNESEFAKAVANDSTLKMKLRDFANPLKTRNQDYKAFIEKVADIKTNQFLKGLMNYYKDPTTAEIVFDFLKSLVPFYTCIENIRSGNVAVSVLSCSLDVLSLTPVVGVAAKYSKILTSSLTFEMRQVLLNSLSKTGLQFIGMRQIYQTLARTVAKELITKRLLKDLLIGFVRTLDPGCELSYHAVTSTNQVLWKMFKKLPPLRNIPELGNLLRTVKSALKIGNPDHTGLVPLILDQQKNYQLVRYVYPGGSHPFGPACLSSFGKTVELRSIKGNPFQIPVVPLKSPEGLTYRQFNPDTGKTFKTKLEMGRDNLLQRLHYHFYLDKVKWNDAKIVRNYQVYYNTVHWKKKLKMNYPDSNSNPGGDSVGTGDGNGISEGGDYNNLPGTSSGNVLPPPIDPDLPGQAAIPGRNFPESVDSNRLTSGGWDSELLKGSAASKDSFPSGDPILLEDLKSLREVFAESEVSELLEKSKLKVSNKMEEYTIPSKGEKRKTMSGDEFDLDLPKKRRKSDEKPVKVADVDDEVPGTSKQTAILSSQHRLSVSAVQTFVKSGLTIIKTRTVTNQLLRVTLTKLALLQIKAKLPMPTELWCTQIVTRQKVINYLKNTKGGSFFFNDITLLSKRNPATIKKIPIGTSGGLSRETEIRYHLTIGTQYGFVDLSQLDPQFQGDYTTFNDVFFKVTDTFFTDRNNVLIIELETQPLSGLSWIINRKQDLASVMQTQVLSPRMESISKAANFMAENVPLCTYKSAQEILTGYILKIQTSLSVVPTYEQFATDYYNNMRILRFYETWKINNWKYIDDLLFDGNLDKITDGQEAERRIDTIYDLVYQQKVDEVFAKYIQLPEIQRPRFEDYYVLYSHYMSNAFIMNKDGNRRFAAAIYRSALRQCDETWIKTPIRIYRGKMVKNKEYLKLSSYREKDQVEFSKFRQFSTERDKGIRNSLNGPSTSTSRPILLEIELRNQAGVMDLGRIFQSQNTVHIVCPVLTFIVDEVRHEIIHQRQVLIVKMHDFEMPTEKRMVDIAEKLDSLYSTDTEFYFTEKKNYDLEDAL